jgi:hypothetical protein
MATLRQRGVLRTESCVALRPTRIDELVVDLARIRGRQTGGGRHE